MDIGQKLKNARVQSGLKQEDVADTVGVSRQTISNWENNRSYPDIGSVLKLSDLYAVSLDELLKEDANMRKHVEESSDLLKKCWDVLYDVSIALLPMAQLMIYFGFETFALILQVLSVALFVVPRLLYPKLFGGSMQRELMRIGAYALLIGPMIVTVPLGNLFQTAGLVLIIYVHYQEQKLGVNKKTNWLVVALIFAVPAVIWLCELDTNGAFNEASPFGHTYRVEEVLYGDEDPEDAPMIDLDSSNQLYIMDPQTRETANLGEMIHVELAEGNQQATTKGIWQLVPEEDGSLLYKVTVEADDSVTLSCQKNEQLQWKYRLSRVDTIKCSISSAGSYTFFTPRWFAEGTFSDHSNLEYMDILQSGTVGFTPEWPVDVLTIYEEYYTDGAVEYEEHTLIPNEKGALKLELRPRYDSGEQYAIYRIPYEDGEYVFRVNYS